MICKVCIFINGVGNIYIYILVKRWETAGIKREIPIKVHNQYQYWRKILKKGKRKWTSAKENEQTNQQNTPEEIKLSWC